MIEHERHAGWHARETALQSRDLDGLRAAMTSFVADQRVAGVAWLVGQHGRIVDSGAVGMRDLAQQWPLRHDTILRIYSMTKPIVSAAMMVLHDEGRWRLDDSMDGVLPEFARLSVIADDDPTGIVPARRAPTLRELLSHTAGLGYGVQATGHPVDAMFGERGVLGSASLQHMAECVATIPLKFQPGTSWGYSIATDLLGLVVERLSGRRLGEFLAERIFEPLGMRDTGFSLDAEQAARLATLYVGDDLAPAREFAGRPLPDPTLPPAYESGGGGLYSTLEDYGRFCAMLLSHGAGPHGAVLSADALALMTTDVLTPQVLQSIKATDAVGFGLGLLIARDPARLGLAGHAMTLGFAGAGGTWFWLDPTHDLYCVGGVQRLDGNLGDLSAAVARERCYSALAARMG